jgi:hypothetical protein
VLLLLLLCATSGCCWALLLLGAARFACIMVCSSAHQENRSSQMHGSV